MTSLKKAPTKTEIARALGAKISAHLRRFERDPKINAVKRRDQGTHEWVPDEGGVRDYYGAHAYGDRHRVWGIYATYQGGDYLSVEDAAKYLAWLDASNVGRHFKAFQEVMK